MFADIAAYTRSVISLYLIEDGNSGCCADEYLFNSKTISGSISSTSGDEEMPPPFATHPPLFSYC